MPEWEYQSNPVVWHGTLVPIAWKDKEISRELPLKVFNHHIHRIAGTGASDTALAREQEGDEARTGDMVTGDPVV